MNSTRRTFIQYTALLAAAMPLVKTRLAAAVSSESATSVPSLPTGSLLREILFSPSNITERKNCYDRFEPLQKPTQNPVMMLLMSAATRSSVPPLPTLPSGKIALSVNKRSMTAALQRCPSCAAVGGFF